MQYRLFVRVEEGGKTNTKDGLSRRVRNGSFLTFRTYQSTLPERSVAPSWQILEANPATHPREDKRANSTRALHHLISLKRALVTATDTAPRKSQRPEGRWGKRSGQYGLQAKSMPPQAPYRPYHEPSAMPARSKTPWRRGQISGLAHAISRASCQLPFRYGCPHTQSSNKKRGGGS